ncbi:MAG: cache domain-containing protein [Syntrophales bacterium]
MKKAIALGVIMSFLVCGLAPAAEKATSAEAEAFVKRAVAFFQENGKEKAFAEFSKPGGKFNDRELYIYVYDMSGKCLAHGLNQKMIGKDLIDIKDPDGKEFNRELIETAKTKGKGWVTFKFTNPLTKKIQDKLGYVEKAQDVVIGSGIYK